MSKVVIKRKRLDRLIGGTGEIVQQVQSDTLDEMATFMHQRVHVITGETRGSIEADHQENTVSADFGAVWEFYRGGPHDFISPSVQEAMGRVPDKVEKAIRRLTGGPL